MQLSGKSLCLLLLGGLFPVVALAQKPAEVAKKVDAYVMAQIASQRLAGVSVSVVKDNKLVFAKGYGKANLEVGVPATKDTMYEIGSITKQFTATAVMMLVEERKIGLDDPVSKYYKFAPGTWRKATIRHLLNHTSGVKDYTDVGDVVKMFREQHSADELMKTIVALPLNFQPGEKWVYCNTNYYLLGLIVESVSGKPLEEFLRSRIFQPAGMSVTCTTDPASIIPNRASGYGWNATRFRNYDALNPTAAGGAGFLESNVLDMANWAMALESGKLLKPESFKEVWTAGKLNDGRAFPYGFGWVIDSYRGRKHIWHNGGTTAHRAMISRFPEDKLTVIVLCNTENGHPEPIAKQIAALYSPALAAYKEKAIPDKDVKTTQRLKTLLQKMIDATAEPELFNEAMRKALFPDALKQLAAQVNKLGPMNAFGLVKFTQTGNLRSYEYQVVLGSTNFHAFFAIDGDDKIAGVNLKPE